MHVLIVDHNLQIPAIQKIRIDLMILSANVKIDLPALITAFRPKWIVADASNKTEKIKYWRTTCDSMSVPFHDVTIQGAFVLNQR